MMSNANSCWITTYLQGFLLAFDLLENIDGAGWRDDARPLASPLTISDCPKIFTVEQVR